MKLVLIVSALIVLNLLRGLSAANTTLELPSDLWERSSTQIKCISDTEDSNVYNITEVKFWKENSSDVYFVYTKPCSTNKFTVANDTTGGRIAFTTSNTIPTWVNLTNEDSGSYRCSLVLCWAPNEVQVSDSVSFTVHKYNTAPELLEPTQMFIYGYFGDTINLTFTCEGYVGYPPGNLSLVEVRGYKDYSNIYNWSSVVAYPNMTTDSLGNARQTVTIPVTFKALDTNAYVCVTYKEVGSMSLQQDSVGCFLDAEYPPTINYELASDYGTTMFYEENIQVNISRSGFHHITCIGKSSPDSKIGIIQVSGPTEFVLYTGSRTITIDTRRLHKDERLQCQCIVEYQSKLQPVRNVTLTGLIDITLHYVNTETSTMHSPTTAGKTTAGGTAVGETTSGGLTIRGMSCSLAPILLLSLASVLFCKAMLFF